MENKYFIIQPEDVSGVLPGNVQGLYCKSNNTDISCLNYDIKYIMNITEQYGLAKNNSNQWVLLDLIDCSVIATTTETGDLLTEYTWTLTSTNDNLGKIVIHKIKNNPERLIGRFRPVCVRCPIEGSPCNAFTYDDLAERRKIEILKYKKNTETITETSKTSKINYAKIINVQRNTLLENKRSSKSVRILTTNCPPCTQKTIGKCRFTLCYKPNVPYTK